MLRSEILCRSCTEKAPQVSTLMHMGWVRLWRVHANDVIGCFWTDKGKRTQVQLSGGIQKEFLAPCVEVLTSRLSSWLILISWHNVSQTCRERVVACCPILCTSRWPSACVSAFHWPATRPSCRNTSSSTSASRRPGPASTQVLTTACCYCVRSTGWSKKAEPRF